MTQQLHDLPTASMEAVGDFSQTASPAIRFADACAKVEADRLREGIGTLGEKTLHAVLKHFYEPDTTHHEQKIGTYFADIEKDGRIIEIQTRDLYRLKAKLRTFLNADFQVTIVHPLPRQRWIYWIGEDGTLSDRRKSPKIGKPHHALPELSGLVDLLFEPGLTVVLLLLDVEDFRNLDGWSKDKKKGSSRYERMPVAYAQEIVIRTKEDLRQLLPPDLPRRFTAAEFYKKGGYKGRSAYYTLKLMENAGVISQTGKDGRRFIYELSSPEGGASI